MTTSSATLGSMRSGTIRSETIRSETILPIRIRLRSMLDREFLLVRAKLLEIAPQLGQPMADRLISIPGQVPDLSSLPQGCAFAPRCDRATAVCRNETPLAESARDARLVTCFNPLGGEA